MEVDDKNRRNLTAVDEEEKKLLKTTAQDLEIMKLLAFYSQRSMSQKNVGKTTKNVLVSTSATSMKLPPPVIFRRRKVAGSNRPAAESQK
jgi:hypothetical protein